MNALAPIADVGLRALIDANPMVGPRKTGGRRFWTGLEEKIVRDHYPMGGIAACLPLLPGRSAATIYQRAQKLGVHAAKPDGTARKTREVWHYTPQMDEAIRRVYQGEPDLGALKHLAVTLMRPYASVKSRAMQLGLTQPRFRPLPWSEAELEILRGALALHPGTIRRKLKAAGFSRSITAIMVQRKRFGRRPEDDTGALGATEVADAFGVSRETVARWLASGLLGGTRVESHSVPQGTPAHLRAHWRISRAQLKAFIAANVALVDFRKVDKVWLVELLLDRRVTLREPPA